MSIRAMTWVWDQPISPNHKIVLLAIADHAHDDGTNAWPSADRIAEMTGYATRSVRRLIKEMVDAGYLTIEAPGGGRHTSRYAIPVGSKLDPQQSDGEGGQNDTPPVTPATPQPGHQRQGTPDTGDRGTIREPSEEPSKEPSAAEAGDRERDDPAEEPPKLERIRDLAVPDAIIEPADLNPTAGDRLPVPADREADNPLWNSLEDVFGYRPTGAEARHWGKLTKELKLRGAAPDQIPARAARLVAQWGAKALTPASLVKHWDRFGSPIGAATEADETRLRQGLDRQQRRQALEELADPDPDEDPYHRAMREAREQREAILAADAEFGPDEREDPAP